MSSIEALRVHALDSWIVPVSAKTAWIFLRLRLSDGSEGWGEASFFGYETAMQDLLARLARDIADRRPQVVGPTLDLLTGRNRNVVRDVLRNGIEVALHDALARRAGVPMATLLGGPNRASIRVYANINRGIADRSPAGFARAAMGVVAEEGYGAIKIAPFDGYVWDGAADRRGFEVGLARIVAVREAVGAGVDLLVDCHARFSPSGAIDLIRECAALNLFWIEEPVDPARISAADQRRIRASAQDHGTMIAGGEELETLEQTSHLLDRGAYDVILPDLRLSGLRRGMAMLELAVSRGVMASLHNPAGPVLDAASRHVALALGSCLLLERQVRESPLYTAIGGVVEPIDGAVGAGDGPGLGMLPDLAVIEAAAREAQSQISFVGMAGAGPDA